LAGREEGHAAGRPDGAAPALGQRTGTVGQRALAEAGPGPRGPGRPTVEGALEDIVDLVVAAKAEIAGGAVVARVEAARGVEREALGIAKAPGEHLLAAAVVVHPQDLAAEVVLVGGAGGDEAFAGGHVEVAVGPELDP